jgi:NAD(P)-dependent dehydrogenase (short-subunit alcohol dehydrogenase family)
MSLSNLSKNRVVLITGGSRGIGRALVEKFKDSGWSVATCGTSLEKLADSRADLKFQCDVRQSAEVSAGIKQVLNRFGQINVLINNAGLAGSNPLSPDNSDDLWQRILDVNLNGTYLMSKHVAPHLPDQTGRIINIASVLALKGVPDATAYCAAKHGVLGFTRAFAQTLAARKIPVNAICPGWTRTDMAIGRMSEIGITEKQLNDGVPFKRFVEPSEVADLAYFLATSPASAMITGQAIVIDGGSLL